MEFCERSEEYWASDDEKEEALSFCDLVSERETLDMDGIGVSSWDSSTGSEDFDFEFGRSTSAATDHSCPADDLFHQGRLLPLTVQRSRRESDAKIACSKSNENQVMLNEKMQAWRIDSMNFTETTPRRGNPAAPSGKSKSKGPAAKTSLKWQFFTLGLMKTPPMKLEDMRLRQSKTSNSNGVDNLLKRSVSCNYEDVAEEAVKFERRSKSVKENIWAEETQPRSKGWKILAPLTSLNGCKASSNSVINCSTTKKRADSRVLAEERKEPAKKPPLYADQNSLSFGSRFSKTAASAKAGGGGGVTRERTMFSNAVNGSRLEFQRLSFHKASYPTATLQSV